jgi:hypothetical protein
MQDAVFIMGQEFSREGTVHVVWQADVGFSKIPIFWLIWVLSTSKRTKKEEFQFW